MTFSEADKSPSTTEGEILPKAFSSKDESAAVGPTEDAQIKMEHIEICQSAETPASEATSRESLITVEYATRGETKTMSDERDFQDDEKRTKAVSLVEEMKVKGRPSGASLEEEEALEKRLKPVKSKEMKTESIAGEDQTIQRLQEKDEEALKAAGQEQMRGDHLVVPRKRKEETYPETLDEVNTESTAGPSVREPSVTDQKKPPQEAEASRSREAAKSSGGTEGKPLCVTEHVLFDLSTKRHRVTSPIVFRRGHTVFVMSVMFHHTCVCLQVDVLLTLGEMFLPSLNSVCFHRGSSSFSIVSALFSAHSSVLTRF